MEVIKKTQDALVLRMDANESLANALRRSVNEVSSLAVDEVEFYKNDSALYDEVLALRIGLVPLKMDKKTGEKTEMQLKLSKKGPCTVYSGDLEGAKVVFDKMPLTILREGQEVEFIATARMGKGSEHIKYAPGLCYYRHLLEVKADSKIDKIVELSKGVIKPEKKSGHWLCDLEESSVLEIEKINPEAVKESGEIVLFVESFGQMEASEILEKSVKALEHNLAEFEKALK